MKKALKFSLIFLTVGVFVWTLYFLYKKSQTPPVEFKTENPFVTKIVKKTVATGTVIPDEEIEIKSKVSGIIEKVFVEGGQIVKKGDILMQIKIIPDMVNLRSAESRVSRAEINLDRAKADFDRHAPLMKDNVISAVEFQEYQIAYKNAQEEISAARDYLQLIKEGVTKKTANQSNTLIRSTINGMVLDVPVKKGKTVIESNTFNEGTTIAFVANMENMMFYGKIDESEVGKIKKGMDLSITIGALEGQTFKGLLTYIAPKGQTEDKEKKGAIQFEIRARVNLKEGQFVRAGYSANADIILDQKNDVLAIHESLLQFEKDDPFVEIKKSDNTFEKRAVKLGLSDGINIEVLSGLQKDDQIKILNSTEEKI
ncbi:MAG TPA: efflux RND transporter periplasmic adaptor subunit [Cytophagaceae bacterium]|jgi:HlyD family secretion protein